MSFTSLVFLALAMSTDAFAAAIGKGAVMQKPRLFQALRIGLLFGIIEAITPVIGWAIGSIAAAWIAEWDHWIAFILLLVLGGRMIWEGAKTEDEAANIEEPKDQSFVTLALTAVATSIDAMAVGVGLAFIEVSIVEAALLIGLATTIMVTIGIMVGRYLGSVIGKKAEIGGLVLIGVGAIILMSTYLPKIWAMQFAGERHDFNACVDDEHPESARERGLTAHDDANGYVRYPARRAYRANADDAHHGYADADALAPHEYEYGCGAQSGAAICRSPLIGPRQSRGA